MIDIEKVLLVGASGMGMVPLALYLKGLGLSVEAYDDNFKEPIRTILKNKGITVLTESVPLNKPDCVIRSSAVNEKSEILKPWLKTKVPIYRER